MAKITIKDIASKAGVSPGTVSKVITGKYKEDNIQISKATIQKVQQIIKEMDYQPNYAARILSTGKTFTIGIFMPKSKNENFHMEHYYSRIIDSIEKEAVKHKYDILLINYDTYIHKFNARRMDGLIIIEQWDEDKDLQFLITEKKHFVIINNLIDKPLNINSVNVDNNKGIQEIVRLFKEHNHKKLAFIGEMTSQAQKEHSKRLELFKQALQKEGLSLNEDIFLYGPVEGITDKLKYEDYDQLSGFFGIEYLLKKHGGQFTGVFCANDLVALGALNYLYREGIKVPQQVSIAGFDDLDFAEYLMGGLTTVRQPLARMGQEAFALLLKSIDNEMTGNEKILVPPEVVVRSTIAKI
ncbi:MAG: LacI family DNA-binding transcriptional regulator [Spirochaetes bacterium]|nr:LacI family DNA-binding transcriptional regulator [Spirochaetota bacterium]